MLGSPVYRAGETINGHVVLRPKTDLPNGDVAVYRLQSGFGIRSLATLGRDEGTPPSMA